MKYLSLELIGYKRMLLNNVKRFVIKPTEPTQLILGTNGSGKSSLLQELTPLPASKDDYAAGGSKTIIVEQHGVLYDLKSTFTDKQLHSFVQGGKELNEGGTLSVQKDLVKKWFKITPEIHALTTSQIGFCMMSPSDRRYWFTRLSDTNYDYAIAVYNKLKERHRDTSGALKLSKSRLVTETAKLVSAEEKLEIENQVTDLHDLLQHLMEYRQPQTNKRAELEDKAIAIEAKISNLFTTLMKKKLAHKGRGLTLEQAGEQLQTLENKRDVEKLVMDRYFTDHAALNESVTALKATGGEGSAELKKKIYDLEDKVLVNRHKRKLSLEIVNPKNMKDAFDSVYDSLISVFSTIPENPDKKYSRAALLDVSDKASALKFQLATAESDLNKLSVKKANQEHQKSHDMVTCPKCSHVWPRGYDEEFYNEVTLQIERLQSQIDEVTTQQIEAEALKSEIVSYSEIYKQFSACAAGTPILKPLWDFILSTDQVYRRPRMVLVVIDQFKYDLNIELESDDIEKEIARTRELLVLSEKVGEADLSKLQADLTALEDKISVSTGVIQDLNTEVKNLSTYKRDMEDIIALAENISLLSANFSQLYTETIESIRRDFLIDAIRSVQGVLSRKETQLGEMNMQLSVIDNIQSQVLGYELDLKAYKVNLDALSPVDGLIAEGLLGFISRFVKNMNKFIARIWMYPLDVVPCGLASDGQIELDYKFPLMVKDRIDPVPDVKLGSTAMREVIDLAFKLTAMKYLGLEESPLMLDEFGGSFDAAHRIAGVEAVKNLLDQQPFTQLFMVNHYESSYGALTNAQVCAICSNNIVIPKGAVVNTHVIME